MNAMSEIRTTAAFDVMVFVAEAYNIKVEDILSHSKSTHKRAARYVTTIILMGGLGMSQAEIGNVMKRHYSTITKFTRFCHKRAGIALFHDMGRQFVEAIESGGDRRDIAVRTASVVEAIEEKLFNPEEQERIFEAMFKVRDRSAKPADLTHPNHMGNKKGRGDLYTDLWCAALLENIETACRSKPVSYLTNEADIRKARVWIGTPSFYEVCENAGLDGSYMMRKLEPIIANWQELPR